MASDKAKDGELDLAILYPERQASIAGVDVVVREYGFVEALRLAAPIAALCDAVTDTAMRGEFHDLDSLRLAFGGQREAVVELVAASCDQPVEWVADLSADDGEGLLLMWWGVNSVFFLKRVLLSVQLQKARELKALAGQTSTPSSLPPGTTPASSEPTPGDS